MIHPDEHSIQRYISSLVSEEEQLHIDTHLAECPVCSQRIQTLRYIRENFDSLWDSWTAGEHGRVYRQLQLVKTLTEIATAKPSLAERLKQWLEQLGEGLEISTRVLLDRSRKIASVAAVALPRGYEFKLRPAYVGVGSPEEQTRLEDHLKKGSDLLSQGKIDEATGKLLEAVEINARYPQAAVSEIRQDERLLLQVIVESRRRKISVKYWPSEGQEPPILAVLLPKHSGIRASAAEFEPIEGEQYVLAEFAYLTDGAYSLQIAPPVLK